MIGFMLLFREPEAATNNTSMNTGDAYDTPH